MKPRHKWYLYILKAKDKSLYTGVTTDIKRRIREHNCGKGAKSLRSKLPARLVYQEEHPSRSMAQSREAEIKRWTHAQKSKFITRSN